MYSPLITDGSKKFGNNRWLSYSSKLGRSVYLFSDLEYEHWLLVESNPKITQFCEQPLLMEAFIDGKYKSSIIDMWVKYDDGNEEFLEIKYSSDLNKESVVKQIDIQKKWCNEHEFKHQVKTEKNIRSNMLLLSNLKLLVKGDKLQKQEIVIDRYHIRKKLLQHNPKKMTINTLFKITQIPISRLLLSVGQMILNGQLHSDIAQNYYGLNTEVWIDD